MTSRRGRRRRRGRSRPCEGPTGIAYDKASNRIFSGCNKTSVVVDPTTGHVVASIANGTRVDALGWDPSRKLIYIPNGAEGNVTVVHQDSPDKYTVVATVPTFAGAKTIAVDPKTHNAYLFQPERGPVRRRRRMPPPEPGGTRPRSAGPHRRGLVYRHQVVIRVRGGRRHREVHVRKLVRHRPAAALHRGGSDRLSRHRRDQDRRRRRLGLPDRRQRGAAALRVARDARRGRRSRREQGRRRHPRYARRARHRDRAGAESRLHQQRPRQQRDDLRSQDAEGDRHGGDRREPGFDPLRRRIGTGVRLQRPIEERDRD